MGDCSLTEPSGRLSSFQGRVEALGYIKLKKDGFPSSLLYLQIHYQFWSTVQHIMKRAQGRSSNFRESGPCGLSDTGWKVPWFNWPQLLTRVQRQCFKGLRHNVKRMLSWQMKNRKIQSMISVSLQLMRGPGMTGKSTTGAQCQLQTQTDLWAKKHHCAEYYLWGSRVRTYVHCTTAKVLIPRICIYNVSGCDMNYNRH